MKMNLNKFEPTCFVLSDKLLLSLWFSVSVACHCQSSTHYQLPSPGGAPQTTGYLSERKIKKHGQMSDWSLCVLPVPPVWSITVCGICCASVGVSVWRDLMGLQPAPPLYHQKGAVREQYWKTAWPMSSRHHSLCQLPSARQTHGLNCELCIL